MSIPVGTSGSGGMAEAAVLAGVTSANPMASLGSLALPALESITDSMNAGPSSSDLTTKNTLSQMFGSGDVVFGGQGVNPTYLIIGGLAALFFVMKLK